jgi:pSer/pThr/pTyr-binding forkhead associated (FHA) protein
MSFRLRYRSHDLDLPPGRFVIGRATDAHLSLDDGLVSRHHAALDVDEKRVSVEDLESRNGTLVNGRRIQGAVELVPGDVVKIGSQELVLSSTKQPVPAARAAATQRFDRLGLVGELAEKALALGRPEEAERVVAQTLRDIADDAAHARGVDDSLCVKAARLAVRLAAATKKGAWVDYAVRLYHRRREPLPSDVVDALHEVMRKVGPLDLPAFRAYIALLREQAEKLGPAERFLLSRIEGLERMASLR